MAGNTAPPNGSWFRAWGGLVVGMCVVISALLRLGREGWTWVDPILLVAGIALIVFWAAKLISLGWTSGRKSQENNHIGGSGGEQPL